MLLSVAVVFLLCDRGGGELIHIFSSRSRDAVIKLACFASRVPFVRHFLLDWYFVVRTGLELDITIHVLFPQCFAASG
jgi:hypothetical protein